MQYYVIGPDGNRYGPGDEPTLKQWVMENRITANTMLEQFETGQRLPASSIPGLFPTTQEMPMGYQQAPMHYPRYSAVDNGSNDLTWSFIWTAAGYLCCPIICPAIGLTYANKAMAKGNPSALGARIFAIVTLAIEGVVVLIYIVIFIIMIAAAASGAGQPQ